MYNYTYFLLYTHQLQYLQKANVYVQNDLAFIPHPTSYSKVFPPTLFLACLGEIQEFQKRYLYILDRILDSNTHKDKYEDKIILISGMFQCPKSM